VKNEQTKLSEILKNSKLEVDGKPVGEYFHQGMHARTHGRTTRKHNAAAAHCRMGDRGMKIHFKSSSNGKQNKIIEVRFYVRVAELSTATRIC